MGKEHVVFMKDVLNCVCVTLWENKANLCCYLFCRWPLFLSLCAVYTCLTSLTTVKTGVLGCAEDHRLYILSLHGWNNTTLNLQHWGKKATQTGKNLFNIQFLTSPHLLFYSSTWLHKQVLTNEKALCQRALRGKTQGFAKVGLHHAEKLRQF